MKLLIASAIDTNPYVNTLVNEIKRTDNSITMDKGADIFWSETATQYDIIHIMWPEELIYAQDWRTQTKSIQDLRDRLVFLKNNNVKIVCTCHDMQPHHWQNEPRHRYDCKCEAYKIVHSHCDMIIHLGAKSQIEFTKSHPQTKNIIIPHQTYEELYDVEEKNITKTEYNIICIGQVRNCKEQKLINDLASACSDLPVKITAPSMYASRRVLCSLPVLMNLVRSIFIRTFKRNLKFGFRRFIKDDEINKLFNHAQIGFIQRVKINNSGNLPLNMLFGNVVIGPNDGNVGYWLKETGNVEFDVSKNPINLRIAVEKAISLVDSHKGEENRIYALKNWNTHKIGIMHINAYKNLLDANV